MKTMRVKGSVVVFIAYALDNFYIEKTLELCEELTQCSRYHS